MPAIIEFTVPGSGELVQLDFEAMPWPVATINGVMHACRVGYRFQTGDQLDPARRSAHDYQQSSRQREPV